MIEKRQAQALAALACSIRPSWGHQGVMAAIGQVRHLELAEVTQAVTRAALDPELRTPGAIGNTTASCWRPNPAATPTTPSGPKAGGCYVCGKTRYDCERNPHSAHVFKTADQAEADAVPCPPELHAQLRALLRGRRADEPTQLAADPTDEDPMLDFWEDPS